MSKINTRPRVRMDELGIYLTAIEAEFKPKTTQERADLITMNFNVLCLVEDIEHYEEFYHHLPEEIMREDYELDSRRELYFQSINRSNPFY
jgi:hypothetical protein